MRMCSTWGAPGAPPAYSQWCGWVGRPVMYEVGRGMGGADGNDQVLELIPPWRQPGDFEGGQQARDSQLHVTGKSLPTGDGPGVSTRLTWTRQERWERDWDMGSGKSSGSRNTWETQLKITDDRSGGGGEMIFPLTFYLNFTSPLLRTPELRGFSICAT